MTILKLIRCQVAKEQKQMFADAQVRWNEIVSCPGFIKQIGGWDQASQEAVISSYWQSAADLAAFMTNLHDQILEQSQQQQTHKQLAVRLYQPELTIPSDHTQSDEKLHTRIVYCNGVNDEKRFLSHHSSMWNPALGQQHGMRGGTIWRSCDTPNNFIIQTFWESELAHSRYLEDLLPELIQALRPMRYIQSISSSFIVEEPSWRVESQ